MQFDATAATDKFLQVFGPAKGAEKVHVIRAPGRVNLIGEHTDYNDGFVFPMAIEPEVRLVCRARNDGRVRLASSVYNNELVEFSLQQKIERGEAAWGNYCRGVAAQLIAAGIPLVGMDGLLTNTLPVGGGLSSSAAVEVATALGLLTLAGNKMDLTRLALLCQRAEREYAGVPCGIMDQTIVCSGRAGHAMLLDCRDNSKTFVKVNPVELRIVIVNSMVRHELSGGEYAQRRRQCEEGVAIFQREHRHVRALRDVTLQQLDATRQLLSDLVYRRCRHVISENLRTVEAAKALAAQRYEKFGELMVMSHTSLRDDYEVSCPELDYLVDEAMKIKGVYGARMTGGGFGGSIVAMVQPRGVEPLTAHLHSTYTSKFGRQPSVLVTTATAGAGVAEQAAMSEDFREILHTLENGEHLSRPQARQAILHVMSGAVGDDDIRRFLIELDYRRATVDELAGAAGAMREMAVPIDTGGVEVLDTCGTGGDVRHTFNISTAAALIAASCGVKIVKHGNRSASSKSGSADVLEKLGVNLAPGSAKLMECLQSLNICFAFARAFHPAMKHVAAVRSTLSGPTIFNLLGPLTNPGNARLHLLGVFSPDLTERLAGVLRELGSSRAWVVSAEDGLDELSTLGRTRVSELANGKIATWVLEPLELGLARAHLNDLQVSSVGQAAQMLSEILDNGASPRRDIAVLNAAAAITIGGKSCDLAEGISLAEDSLKSGSAKATLQSLVRLTRD